MWGIIKILAWVVNILLFVAETAVRVGRGIIRLVLGAFLLVIVVGALSADSITDLWDDAGNKPPTQVNYPTRPTQNIYVTDNASMLSAQDRANILEIGADLDKKHKAQLAVVTVQSLDGRPIEEYSTELFRTWGIGDKKLNNGVLLLISRLDRKFRIEVGYGLEGALPDSYCKKVLNEMTPYFKVGDYSPAIMQAYFKLAAKAYAEYGDDIPFELSGVPPPKKNEANLNADKKARVSHDDGIELTMTETMVLGVIIILIIFFVIFFGGSGGGGFGGGGFSSGGFSGGSSSSGGFGGGSSGGGGASGSW